MKWDGITPPSDSFVDEPADPKAETTKILKYKDQLTGQDITDIGATKHDAGKPDLSLLLDFGKALQSVAAVGTMGAKKYSRGGWKSVPDGLNRYTAALLRHLTQENTQFADDESGFAHASHVAWNALARLQLIILEMEKHATRA